MLTDRRIKPKLNMALDRYRALVYEAVADVPVQIAETQDHLRNPSATDGLEWRDAAPGTVWGKPWWSAWFRGSAVLPKSCEGEDVFVCAKTGAVETLLFVDGVACGLLDSYAVGDKNLPHHLAKRICASGKAGQTVEIAIEAYAGHPSVGSNPRGNSLADVSDEALYRRTFESVQLALCHRDVKDFYLDLRVLLSLADSLDQDSLRFGKVMAGLSEVYAIIPQIPSEVPESEWRPALAKAREVMKPLLEAKNGDTAPFMGLTGHSHLDTAWLWTIDETIRKAARTFSNALSMMDQYPEYQFMQSAPCHADFVRVHYPEIFERIREAVKAGRWEPNGGMWVEPDCNITSGEAMIRQFLYGQASTQKWYGYRSDAYWQPDVFGYSAAIPQIMRGCGVDYFLTTKLSWNDTNPFPYDTFRWRGIDGTEVIAHFNTIHSWPDPKTLSDQWKRVLHKDVQDRRLSSYGFGDGGGGPQDEMIEITRRVVDLEGCPRARHISVSEFMHSLEQDLGANLPIWSGELYLELHRGTLTSIHGIKRGNRKSELALRDAEWAWALASTENAAYPADRLEDLWKLLLVNQFHDILPGSSITEVNVRAVRELEECTSAASALAVDGIRALGSEDAGSITIANSLNWAREGDIVIPDLPEDMEPGGAGIMSQSYEDVQGRRMTAVSGMNTVPLGVLPMRLVKRRLETDPCCEVTESGVETPYATIRFDDRGRIVSFLDKNAQRQLVRKGGAFNTFWIAEDIPESWDNWDVDADYQLKLDDSASLISREVASIGPLQLRIRSKYRIGEKSIITQDMVFHHNTPRIDFETLVDWQETHKLLKAGFDTSIVANDARHEIQLGHLLRPTHRNLSTDRARFEVCNHKWTDLSEAKYGIALLNDCKYGISALGGDLRLTLLRSGTHPDYRADNGLHRMDYALLPHDGGFSVESVVRPAYEFNVPVIAVQGCAAEYKSLADIDSPDIIVESMKRSEDGRAIIMRMYNADNSHVHCRVDFGIHVVRLSQTNMLEEIERDLDLHVNGVELDFRPFEIKTLRLETAG